MPQFIIQEIIKNIPNGLYYLAIVCIVWVVAKFYFVRFCGVEKKIKDVSDIKKKIDEKIEPTLIKIKLTVDRIARYIITKNALDHNYFSAGSPIELNQFSREVLENSGAKHFIDSSLDFLISEIDELKPKSALDIQQFSVSILFDLIDTEGFSVIKDFVYQNPKYENKEINIPIIINIMALYIRDEYFKKHPEFNKSDLE